jgi:hypothetical protein
MYSVKLRSIYSSFETRFFKIREVYLFDLQPPFFASGCCKWWCCGWRWLGGQHACCLQKDPQMLTIDKFRLAE